MQKFEVERWELTNRELRLLNSYMYAELFIHTDDKELRYLLIQRENSSESESIKKNFEKNFSKVIARIIDSKITVVSVNDYVKTDTNIGIFLELLTWHYVIYDERIIRMFSSDERLHLSEIEWEKDEKCLTFGVLSDYLEILNDIYLNHKEIPQKIWDGISMNKNEMLEFINSYKK